MRQEVTFNGIGLHTGKNATVRLKPAPRDSGIVFHRIDRMTVIRSHVGSVTDTAFATTLGKGTIKLRTVEHLLAALAGLGIDNLIIEVEGPEIPILDGSSTEMVSIILSGGIAKQGKKMPCLRIVKPVYLKDGHAEIAAFPYEGRKITQRIHFDHHLLGEQSLTIDLTEETFIRELAPARTFGFLKDIQYLMANGLAKGGSLNNAVILGEKGVLNSTGLRFKDEFVRHKILDSIGDFSLIGFPVYGHIIAEKGGHTSNCKFIKKLIASPDCWEIVSDIRQPQPQLYC